MEESIKLAVEGELIAYMNIFKKEYGLHEESFGDYDAKHLASLIMAAIEKVADDEVRDDEKRASFNDKG